MNIGAWEGLLLVGKVSLGCRVAVSGTGCGGYLRTEDRRSDSIKSCVSLFTCRSLRDMSFGSTSVDSGLFVFAFASLPD